VQDVIKGSRNNDMFGIDGYYVPDNKAYIEKPHAFMISKTQNQDFMSKVLKLKANMPAPTDYETQVNLLMKKNLSIYKKQR
jgi:hypothetical protein